ncbi:MAG: SMP-30/gluconolactonase/LRE family protein [Pedobacter sp.]|nr:SMP-30/gluconolactonase/LRE family protein [Pedobacter sp.]
MQLNTTFFTFLVLSCTLSNLSAQNDNKNSTLFNQDDLKQVTTNYAFTEGCSSDKDGNIYFTDQPNDKVWKYGTDGKVSLFLEKTGRANGTFFDKKGNLILCADDKGELRSVNRKGKVTVIAESFAGKQLNGPNDIWIDPSGNMFFTDPYYQRDYWTRRKPDLSHQSVYIVPKGSKSIVLAADSLNQPNGIVGSPDGKYLYIADAGAGKIFRYTIGKEGKLSAKLLFINRGSDGMTLDDRGNIYLTGNGITIYNNKGQKIGQIKVPEGTSNVCFGGKKKDFLFITAKTSLYAIPMKVKGVE